MRKQKVFSILLVCLLAFGLVLMACDDSINIGGDNGGIDTWSNVTNINQLNGTWVGAYSYTQTIRQMFEDAGYTWTSEYQQLFGNMIYRLNAEMIININASTRIISGTSKGTYTFSGGNMSDAWPVLKDVFRAQGWTVNDSNHSVTTTQNINEPMTESDLMGIQINQNNTKIRLYLSELGLNTSLDYIVLVRQ